MRLGERRLVWLALGMVTPSRSGFSYFYWMDYLKRGMSKAMDISFISASVSVQVSGRLFESFEP